MPAQERVLRRSTAKTDKKEKQFGSRPCIGVSLAHAESPLRATIILAIFFLNRQALQCFEDEAKDFVEAFRFFSSSFSTLFLSASASAIAMMSSVSGSPADINSP